MRRWWRFLKFRQRLKSGIGESPIQSWEQLMKGLLIFFFFNNLVNYFKNILMKKQATSTETNSKSNYRYLSILN